MPSVFKAAAGLASRAGTAGRRPRRQQQHHRRSSSGSAATIFPRGPSALSAASMPSFCTRHRGRFRGCTTAATNWGVAQALGGGRSDAFQAGVYGTNISGLLHVAPCLAFANNWMTTNRNDLPMISSRQASTRRVLAGGWKLAIATRCSRPSA